MALQNDSIAEVINTFTSGRMLDREAISAALTEDELTAAYSDEGEEKANEQANEQAIAWAKASATEQQLKERTREAMRQVGAQQLRRSQRLVRPYIRAGVPLSKVLDLLGEDMDIDMTMDVPEPKSVREFLVEAYREEAQQVIGEALAEGVDTDEIRQMASAAADTDGEMADYLRAAVDNHIWLYAKEQAARTAIGNHDWGRATEVIDEVRTGLQVSPTAAEKERWRQIVEAVGAVADLEHVRRLAADFMDESSGVFPATAWQLYCLEEFGAGEDRFKNELQQIDEKAAQAMTKAAALSRSDAGLSTSVRETSSEICEATKALGATFNDKKSFLKNLSERQIVMLCLAVIAFVGAGVGADAVRTNFSYAAAMLMFLPAMALGAGALFSAAMDFERKRLATLEAAAEPLTSRGAFPEVPIDKAQREQLERAGEWVASSGSVGG